MKMNRFLKGAVAALALAAGSLSALAVASPMSVDVSGFKINPQLIISLYNVAQQSNGTITSYPANLDPAVITVGLKNNDAQNSASPCFRVDVYDPNQSAPVVTGGELSLKVPLNPGEMRVATANDFIASGSFNGTISQSLKDEFSDFKDVDSAKIGKLVDTLLKRKYRICLVPIACGGGAAVGNSSCDIFTLFTGNPMGDCSVAMLVYPHNNPIYSAFPTFVWAPAQNRSCSQDKLSYQIEVMKDEEGAAPFARVKTAAGASFYQWQAGDPILERGHKYYWRVVGLDCSGTPFCGPSGRGWNIIKWFTFEDQAGGCHYSLADIDDYIRKNASAEIQGKLKAYVAKVLSKPNGLTDPFVCRLLSGQAKLNSIEFQTK
jgi:hypothetical protein